METGNTTEMYQVEVLRELAEATNKRGYDHMFASIPAYDGTNPSQFMEWLESLEQLCRISGRHIRDEAIGRSGKAMR